MNKVNLSIIAKIESNRNPTAYNKKSGARGVFQLMPCVLQEYNTCFKTNFVLEDLFRVDINYTIAQWYLDKRIPQMLSHYKLPDTIENILIAYNFGIGNLVKYRQGKVKLPKETQNYIKKYNEEV